MTAVAFAATEVASTNHWILGTKDKKKRYTIQMPSAAWLAAGVACDLSGSGATAMTYITETHWGPGILVTDFSVFFGIFGTDGADSNGGVTATSCYVAGYGTKNSTSADDVLAALPNATDLSVITALRLTVHGY